MSLIWCAGHDHPPETIPTSDKPIERQNRASAVDEELVDQLRALGYIE